MNYEHIDLFGGYTSEAIKLSYSQPFGKRRDYSIQFKVPITSVVAGPPAGPRSTTVARERRVS